MRRIIVTGGSGKAGEATVLDLLDHGYEVLNIDIRPPTVAHCRFQQVDLTQLGETIEALHGADAVVHLAANPNPTGWSEERMFRHNAGTTYNVFRAATLLSLRRVVWASSETTLGLPFDRVAPAYAPIDEAAALIPESSYALAKVLGETMAQHFSRWSGIPFVGLRFSNIMRPEAYAQFPGYWADPQRRKWNLWGYVDVRDVAQSCRRGLEADIQGAHAFIIAAADTVMNRPSAALMADVYPDVPLLPLEHAYATLLGIGGARRHLGYAPRHSWRDHLEEHGDATTPGDVPQTRRDR
ncbi:MAG: NAD(P)-dependent oxidoreductase [Chloroflexi bacterium]|nr:NAD(P)-dependent oxidoreductase [Chloroflexota bacterium]